MTDSAGPPRTAEDVELLLRRVVDLITSARPMPMSASVLVNRDEVVELVEEALSRLPEELRASRWLLRERDDFLAKMGREGEDILEAARERAERMVQRTEVVRVAQHTARETVDTAEDEARRLRHEAEDYCDQKLAQFEIVLDRTIKTVRAGRERLTASPIPDREPVAAEDDQAAGQVSAFFNQESGDGHP